MLLTIFVWGSGPGPAGPTCETVQPARSLLVLDKYKFYTKADTVYLVSIKEDLFEF